MNAQDSRKLIVAIGMAAVVGVGIMTYAMRPHPVVHVAQAIVPPAPLAEIPPAPAPAAAAPLPEAPAVPAPVAAIPPVVVAPAAPTHKEVAVSRHKAARSVDSDNALAAEPSVAAKRHAAAADSDISATYNTVTPKAAAPDLGMTVAAATVASNAEPAKSATDATAPTATAPDTSSTPAAAPAPSTPAPALAFTPSPSATADLKVDPSAPVAAAVVAPGVASDSQITTEVKSEIAVDSQVKDAAIGVNTTNGVVALSGNLPSQDAIDHVKIVVARVKDVKSVDASGLTVLKF